MHVWSGWWRTHLIGVLERFCVLMTTCVCGAAVRIEDVVGRLERDGLCEELDGGVVLFGGEGFVALIFQRISLGESMGMRSPWY